MSIKMRVFYGDGDSAITDASVDTTIVVFKALDADKEIARMEIDGNDLPADNQQRAYLYGINKLLTDRTSDQKDKVAKLGEMQVVFDLLCSGEWSKERTVGAIVVSCEVQALAEIQEMSIPDAQAALAQYDKETRGTILAHEKVVALAKIIRTRRNAPDNVLASLDDLLGL